MAADHLCLICMATIITDARAFCPACFPTVPWRTRVEFMKAYRRRRLDREGYHDQLNKIQRWKRGQQDHDAKPPRRRPAEPAVPVQSP